MKTSNYYSYYEKLLRLNLQQKTVPVAISLYPPRNSNYLHYPKLAPSSQLLKSYKIQAKNNSILAQRYYTFEFFDQLFKLDAGLVWYELHELTQNKEPVLLCYEEKGFCHRHLVALWFNKHLGQEIKELN